MEEAVHLHEAEHREMRARFLVEFREDLELLGAVRVHALHESLEVSFVQEARGHVDLEGGMSLQDLLLQFRRIGVGAVPFGSAEAAYEAAVDFLGRISVRNVHDQNAPALLGNVVPDGAAGPVFPARQMQVVILAVVGKEIEDVVLPGIAPRHGGSPAGRRQRRRRGKLFFVILGVFSLFANVSFAEDEFDFDDDFVEEVVEDTEDDAENDAEEQDVAEIGEKLSAKSIQDYEVSGSLFQQITDLEQEKILMQLEKERAQLNLELDKLAAEKIKLNMEIENLSGRAEQQQAELDTERARLEAEAQRLEAQKEAIQKNETKEVEVKPSNTSGDKNTDFAKKYKLVNVMGAGSQLQATIQDTSSGQNKK